MHSLVSPRPSEIPASDGVTCDVADEGWIVTSFMHHPASPDLRNVPSIKVKYSDCGKNPLIHCIGPESGVSCQSAQKLRES